MRLAALRIKPSHSYASTHTDKNMKYNNFWVFFCHVNTYASLRTAERQAWDTDPDVEADATLLLMMWPG